MVRDAKNTTDFWLPSHHDEQRLPLLKYVDRGDRGSSNLRDTATERAHEHGVRSGVLVDAQWMGVRGPISFIKTSGGYLSNALSHVVG